MINAYHLSDAMPAALLGMFALWAAASKRHWFIRLAVVATAVLFVLLIPAFEVVVQLGVECLLVVVVLAVWRRRSAESMATNYAWRRAHGRRRWGLAFGSTPITP